MTPSSYNLSLRKRNQDEIPGFWTPFLGVELVDVPQWEVNGLLHMALFPPLFHETARTKPAARETELQAGI